MRCRCWERWFWLVIFLVGANVSVLWQSSAVAWGPHPEITQAALDVVPEMDQWKSLLGQENIQALPRHCLMPDQRGRDLGPFFADDYLLIRKVPYHVGHTMPTVQLAFEPYFRRALQALRTETPVNACRQLGPLVHFVEDVGAPPHAKVNCPHHGELENWVDAKAISIRGYQPQLLGKSDDEAWQGLKRRIDGLVAFSAERAERALPLVNAPNPDRTKVEPILLESALESARVTADVLYTVFHLGLEWQAPADAAGLTGTITASSLPANEDQEAQVVLVDTDYATLAITQPETDRQQWKGEFSFRNLPPGQYTLLAYRVGSLAQKIQVTLQAGQTSKVEIRLAPTEPPGNLVYNPDGALQVLSMTSPDRWTHQRNTYASAPIPLKRGINYRCGGVRKDPKAVVVFLMPGTPQSGKPTPPPIRKELPLDGKSNEIELWADRDHTSLVIQVHSERPFTEAVEKIWVCALPSKPASQKTKKEPVLQKAN